MIKRRRLLQLGAGLLAAHSLAARATTEAPGADPIRRPIPATGELVPVIGMGTSRTFDTDADPDALANLGLVMQAFLDGRGRIIDSSPMYGEAETRVGDVLRAMDPRPQIFAATKVWTTGRENGIVQMEASERRMGIERFDLIAVHNLQDWRTQLETLRAWKEQGRVRYIGVTTSHGRDHEELERVMREQPLDFVQFSYNIEDRAVEERLLPLAGERRIATMINRPYQRGALFSRSRGQVLPALATELGCSSWAQFYLKWILGHPAVTCIIPATASVAHMQDNMRANFGPVPDAGQRSEMLRIFESL